ncbi:MAG: protein-L-isoaspartate O-methyltransferase [Hyphomonadaceae bacterium]|nr:protein-L-isoaspartate O-methyltransferase [Hyphomonadaceae bacterium]
MDFTAARRIMVDSQIRPNDVSDPEYVQAFLTVPREAFVASGKREIAYSEFEIPTGEDRAMWLPRDIAKMLKALAPRPSDVALVIGAGAGYSAALLAQLTETVIAVEEDESDVDRLTERMSTLGYDQVAAIQAPLTAGLPDQAPFDVILICGMVEEVPTALTDQLADGGRLGAVVKMDAALGRARIFSRAGDTVAYRDSFECTPPEFTSFRKPAAFVF